MYLQKIRQILAFFCWKKGNLLKYFLLTLIVGIYGKIDKSCFRLVDFRGCEKMAVKSEYQLLLNYFRGMSKIMEEEWQANARDIGLTLAEQHAIWIIDSKGKASVTEIAKIGLWDRSTVMQILKRLEEKQIVYSTKNKKDLRVTYIALTEEGKQKRIESESKSYKLIDFIMNYQGPDGFREAFIDFHRELNRHFHGDEFIEWVEETAGNLKDEN